MYQYVQKANLYLHDIGNNLSNFFFKYRYVLLISFIVGVIINSIGIFTFKFGVDSEVFPPSLHFIRQRYGSLILYKLFPFLTHNIVSQLVGIIALIFAVLLMISKYNNISNIAKTLFIIMFISCSYFAELQYFFFQSAYNFIAILLAVVAFRLIENNKNIFLYIIAIFFLFIAISSYQSNISIFLSVIMLNIILYFINYKNIKNSIQLFFKSLCLLLLTSIVYYITIKIFSTNISHYYINQIHWLKNSINHFNTLLILFKFIIYKNIWFYIYTFIIIIYIIFNFNTKKERLFFILLSILFFLSVYSLNIIMGSLMPQRARIQLAILPAFTFLLIYIFNNNNIIKIFAIFLALFYISFNSNNTIKFNTSYKITYEQDKITASQLLNIIYIKYPDIIKGKYKLTFYGKMTTSRHLLKPYITSFFTWDGGNPGRILSFMKIMGLPNTVKGSGLIGYNANLSKAPDDLKQLIKKMPSYPSPDCAQLYKDTVIVKLSD
ncbi:MAG: glucosyltransferase domain-containing protein [Mucispirillum sp.]|nr:glucosyltransferase domain-containing protein [Mucispirillum sp.]